MNNLIKSSVLVLALSTASPAAAKSLSISVALNPYRGNAAYAAAYIVDPKGHYVTTVYAAGSRLKYLAHLQRWYRMVSRSGKGIDGSTGASIGSAGGFRTAVSIPDKMINAGYTLRIETAVENQRYYANDASIKLDSMNKGKSVSGEGYVKSLSVKF